MILGIYILCMIALGSVSMGNMIYEVYLGDHLSAAIWAIGMVCGVSGLLMCDAPN